MLLLRRELSRPTMRNIFPSTNFVNFQISWISALTHHDVGRPRAGSVMTAICSNKLCHEFILILLSSLDNGIIIALYEMCVSAIIYPAIHQLTMSDAKYCYK